MCLCASQSAAPILVLVLRKGLSGSQLTRVSSYQSLELLCLIYGQCAAVSVPGDLDIGVDRAYYLRCGYLHSSVVLSEYLHLFLSYVAASLI